MTHTIRIDSAKMISEQSWQAYTDGVRAFLKLQGLPTMRSTVAEALGRATRDIVAVSDTGVAFSNADTAERFYGCLRRALTMHFSAAFANVAVSLVHRNDHESN